MRRINIFNLSGINDFRDKLLFWLKQKDVYAFLNSNGLDIKYGSYDFLCAVGSKDEFICSENNIMAAFKKYFYSHTDWLFGFFTYDLKNELEKLTSKNFDGVGMPLIHFFVPSLVLYQKENLLYVAYHEEDYTPEEIVLLFGHISNINIGGGHQVNNVFAEIQSRVSKARYLKKMDVIKKHI